MLRWISVETKNWGLLAGGFHHSPSHLLIPRISSSKQIIHAGKLRSGRGIVEDHAALKMRYGVNDCIWVPREGLEGTNSSCDTERESSISIYHHLSLSLTVVIKGVMFHRLVKGICFFCDCAPFGGEHLQCHGGWEGEEDEELVV